MKMHVALLVTATFCSACGAPTDRFPEPPKPEEVRGKTEYRSFTNEFAQALRQSGFPDSPVIATIDPESGKTIVFLKEGGTAGIPFPIKASEIRNVFTLTMFSFNGICYTDSNGYERCYP